MKTITFYSEKGGVGKSGMNTLFSGWLHYKHGIKVTMIDFDGQTSNLRNNELKKAAEIGLNSENRFNIINAKKNNKERTVIDQITDKINYEIKNESLKDTQVLVIDLPGIMNTELACSFINGAFGLTVIPINRDENAMRAGLKTMKLLKEMKVMNCSFINEMQQYHNKNRYEAMAKSLLKLGLNVLPDMVSFSERFKNGTSQSTMRSSLTYPDWETKEYAGSKDLGLENLFISIATILDKSPDYKGTEPADLSPVLSLQKINDKQALTRQLQNNSYPELALLPKL